MTSLIDSKPGDRYRYWHAKLAKKEMEGGWVEIAKCTYLGQGGMISKADLIGRSLSQGEPKEGEFQYTIYADDPKTIGGTEKYPDAVLYFLAGAGFCFLSFFACMSSLENLQVEGVELSLRGFLDLNGFHHLAPVPAGISQIDYDLRIKSPESSSKIESVVKKTEEACIVYQTLVHSPKINMKISVSK